ncbi:response regulator [Pseudomonas sp. QL9]|uniref:response regulator n=1 Tax=Pseudomonas sp. QL9 TaxID=3242725 RepID=UPI003529DEA0
MNIRVVLVEDHPAVRLAVRTLLSRDPQFEIVGEASDGNSGLNLVRQERPDLVIIDLGIPGMDGLDLLPRVQGVDPNIRLLVLSSQDERLYANRVEAAGGHGFVSKTRDTASILDAARLLVAGYNCFPNRAANTSSGDSQVAVLTSRELVVLRRLVSGMSNKQIADELFLSQKTISTYKTRILEKLQLSSLVDLVEFAREHNV